MVKKDTHSTATTSLGDEGFTCVTLGLTEVPLPDSMETCFGFRSHVDAADDTASGIVAVKRQTWGRGLLWSSSSFAGARTSGRETFLALPLDSPRASWICSS